MNKNIIIVTGHGHYATGIKSFLKEVAGEITNVEFLDFHSDISVDELKEALGKSQRKVRTTVYCL